MAFDFAGCSVWTANANTAADGGVLYMITSESGCMAQCLASSTCVAFDLGLLGCVIHNNADDLKTSHDAPGVTQFVLNRECLHKTPSATTITTEPAGINNII